MKIISLELKGYAFLMPRGINYVKYTPESLMQLIIGSNGSGKSALFKELSPLPAISSEFSKDGFKSIEITYAGHHYLLQSIFSPQGNKFHFIKDGTELNEGHTVTVYKDLCRLEFGITTDIHSFLLGEKSFTTMSYKDRRTLFTNIADVDFDYAIRYYQRLASQLRDVTGAIKITKSKLQAEVAKKLTEEEENSLRKEVDFMRGKIRLAIESKPRANVDLFDVKNNFDHSLSVINEIVSRIDEMKTEFQKNSKFKDRKDAAAQEKKIQSILDSEKGIYDFLGKQLSDKQRQIEEAQELAGKDLNKYLDERVSLRKQIHQLESELTENYLSKITDLDLAIGTFSSCRDSFIRLVKELPPNRERKFTKAFYETSKAQIVYYQDLLKSQEKDVLRVSSQIDDLKHKATHKDTICPKCDHRWKEGFSQQKLDELLIDKEALESSLKTTQGNLDRHQKDLEECSDYFTKYLNIQSFIKNYSSIEVIWEYILSTAVIFDSPEGVEHVVQNCYSQLELRSMLRDLNLSLIENQKWVEALEARSQSGTNEDKEYSKLENQYWLIGERISQLTKDLHNCSWYLKLCDSLEAHSLELREKLQYHQTQSGLIKDVMKSEYLNEVLLDLNIRLTERESLLSRTNVQNGIVDSLNHQLIELETKRKLLDLACKELSPTSGLIAKGLTGFINHFILQMNSFIKKIWTYPLELCLVNMEEGALDLDYKFKMLVNNDWTLSDVGNGSSAQKEIVDLAFRIVAMNYLKMADFPLFLDEFGSKFDSSHRHMAFHVITSIIATAGFSQIFMISHDEHSYGSLTNCDINVLCDANIVIPEGAVTNKHFLLK